MTDVPKKMTVSFGAFSCTLDGFEDPFPIMRQIVDHFQQIQNDDPEFGALPNINTTDNLAHLVGRQTEAKVSAAFEGSEIVISQEAASDAAEQPEGLVEGSGIWDDYSALDDEVIEAEAEEAEIFQEPEESDDPDDPFARDAKEESPGETEDTGADNADPFEAEKSEDLAALDQQLKDAFASEDDASANEPDEETSKADTSVDDETIEEFVEALYDDPVDGAEEPTPEEPPEEQEFDLNDLAALDGLGTAPTGRVAEEAEDEDDEDTPLILTKPVAAGSLKLGFGGEVGPDASRSDYVMHRSDEEEFVQRGIESGVFSEDGVRFTFDGAETEASDADGEADTKDADEEQSESGPAPLILTQPVAEEKADAAPVLHLVNPVSPEPKPAPVPDGSPASMRDFAKSAGAATLPELLEASAAYVTLVNGRPSFSRNELMEMVDQVTDAEAFSQEARIRTFSTMLKGGKLKADGSGNFTLSPEARLYYERTVNG